MEEYFLEEMKRRGEYPHSEHYWKDPHQSHGDREKMEKMYYEYFPQARRGMSRRTMEGMPVSFIDLGNEYGGKNTSMKEFFDKMQFSFNNMDSEEKEKFHDLMKMVHEGFKGDHFNEAYARHEVSKMFHIESSKKYVGEKFDMNKAREVFEKYRGIIPAENTIADVYVAINAQYHDYVVLFKSWFSDNCEHKIIESAINFWFRDDDCPEGKVWDYFKD